MRRLFFLLLSACAILVLTPTATPATDSVRLRVLQPKVTAGRPGFVFAEVRPSGVSCTATIGRVGTIGRALGRRAAANGLASFRFTIPRTAKSGRWFARVVCVRAGRATIRFSVVALPKAVPTPTPRPTPTPPPTLGSRENPYSVGTPVDLGDGWRMKVEGSSPDATAAVLAENQFNDPPQAGHQFYMARVTATYLGSGSDSFDGTFRLRAVGTAAVAYSTFDNSCGVYPDQISSTEVFTGGTITGNVCWEVRTTDAASLLMFDDPITSVPRRLFFALR